MSVEQRVRMLAEKKPNLIKAFTGREDPRLEHELAASGEIRVTGRRGETYLIECGDHGVRVTLKSEGGGE